MTRRSTALLGAFAVASVTLGLTTGSRTLPAARPAAAQASPLPAVALASASPEPSPLQLLHADIFLADRSPGRPPGPAIAAEAAILVDIDSRTVLWQRNADGPRSPASTTKLMTALVALRNFSLDQPVTVSPRAAAREPVETALGLLPGQQLTVRELLTGMLTVSANDAAWALADGTVGAPRYIDTMNAEAAALGLNGSHFANPSGYPDDAGQVTTPRDLATLMMLLWQDYPVFRDLMSVRDAVIPVTAGHPAFPLHNIVSRVFAAYPPTVAAKSGFTDIAGPCLVSVAIRGNHHLVAVLMNTPSMIEENRQLFEWGFQQEGLPALPSPTPTPSGRPPH